MKKLTVTILLSICIIVTSIPAFGEDKSFEATMDIFLVRPACLAATIVGTAIFIVSLPFSIPSKSVESTAQTFVTKPFHYTFTRPIGEFREEEFIPVSERQVMPAVESGTVPYREPQSRTVQGGKAPSTIPQSPTVEGGKALGTIPQSPAAEKGTDTNGSSNQ